MALPTPGPNDVWGADLNAEILARAKQVDVDAALALKADATAVALKADQTALDNGLALKADLSYVDNALAGKADAAALDSLSASLAGKADQAALDALTAQQNQLMSTAATTEEFCICTQISAVPDGAGGTTLETSGTTVLTLFVAPFPCKILSASFVREYVDLPASSTNYLTMTLERTDTNGTLLGNMAQKDTQGEGITSRKPWNFDGVVWNETYRVLQAGEILRLSMNPTGTATSRCPMHFTVRYQPL